MPATPFSTASGLIDHGVGGWQGSAEHAKHSLNVWSTYELPWYGLTIGGGTQYISSRLASTAPATGSLQYNQAPGYVTFRRWPRCRSVLGSTAQVNATNLGDTKYYDLPAPGACRARQRTDGAVLPLVHALGAPMLIEIPDAD